MGDFSYPKIGKLKQEKHINLLFKKGKWKTSGNLRIIFMKENSEFPLDGNKVGVSVSKRYFKKAVHRNRIKRLLRETYRLHKPLFEESFGYKTMAMLFWVSPELPPNYSSVEAEFLNLCASIKKR